MNKVWQLASVQKLWNIFIVNIINYNTFIYCNEILIFFFLSVTKVYKRVQILFETFILFYLFILILFILLWMQLQWCQCDQMFQKEVSLYSISLETSPILPPEIKVFINDSVLRLDEMRQLSEFPSSWATLQTDTGWGKVTWHDPTTYSGPKQYLDI